MSIDQYDTPIYTHCYIYLLFIGVSSVVVSLVCVPRTMDIPYADAIDILHGLAIRNSMSLAQDAQSIPVEEAVGRVCKQDYYSPISTPTADISAMDGYAVNSESTGTASISNPLTLCVRGTMAAGDAPLALSSDWENDFLSCTEIMTGAQFPTSTSGMPFDACIRIEDTTPVFGPTASCKYIQIVKPARQNQNRRFAGNDFRIQDLIIPAGSVIQPHHVMAFASLGIKEAVVYRRLSIAVLSTGSELLDLGSIEKAHHIRNSNGPYVSSVLQELGVDVTNLGIVQDDCVELENLLTSKINEHQFDAIISTGAVSKGKFDFVRRAIESIGATVLFHGVAVRPGHPMLLATLSPRYQKAGYDHNMCGSRSIALFGLPGNPLAAATCLRFFLIPYLRALHQILPEKGIPARLESLDNLVKNISLQKRPLASSQVVIKPSHLHTFSHGKLVMGLDGSKVYVAPDQGSGKVRPLLSSNCWISIPQGKGALDRGEIFDTFPLYPDSLGANINERNRY